MTKCDYCGEKIGLFSNTWLDKKKDLIVHDKCLEEWHIKFEDQLKEIERLNKIDYKTLSENERLEFREKSDKIFNDIPKNVLYLNRYKPKFTRLPTHDELISCCEDLIEKIENDENFPDKEKVLKDLNKILERLKREGRIIFK
jgi:oligoendopeptidase F